MLKLAVCVVRAPTGAAYINPLIIKAIPYDSARSLASIFSPCLSGGTWMRSMKYEDFPNKSPAPSLIHGSGAYVLLYGIWHITPCSSGDNARLGGVHRGLFLCLRNSWVGVAAIGSLRRTGMVRQDCRTSSKATAMQSSNFVFCNWAL